MKKLLIILAIFASGIVSAQTKVIAVQGKIKLTPDKVFIPSTAEYLYLAKTAGGYAIFVSKNGDLFERFSRKGNDSLIVLEGAVFKPLQHYTKKQWKILKKEIKRFFPFISQKELEQMSFYLLFNYTVKEIPETGSTPTNPNKTETKAPTRQPQGPGAPRITN